MSPIGSVWRGLTRAAAATDPRAQDPRLRGRTYAVPFDRVWTAAYALADGGLRRWRVLDADDQEGRIRAAAGRLFRDTADEVEIRIVLDPDAQTRVDARSRTPEARADLGRNARRLAAFFRALDRSLGRSGLPDARVHPVAPWEPPQGKTASR